jgi:CPA2 family monovalent cation:H+ antiporter-2
MTMNVTSSFLYPVVVAVSSNHLQRLMQKLGAIFRLLRKVLPCKWTKRIERYSSNAQAIDPSTWQIVIRTHLLQIILHTIIITWLSWCRQIYFTISRKFKIWECYRCTDHDYCDCLFLWALSLRRVAVERSWNFIRNESIEGQFWW